MGTSYLQERSKSEGKRRKEKVKEAEVWEERKQDKD